VVVEGEEQLLLLAQLVVLEVEQHRLVLLELETLLLLVLLKVILEEQSQVE
jgi:hypothetical protein